MNVLQLKVTSEKKGSGRFRLYPIGDPHIDKKSFDRKRFEAYIALIAADSHALWILVGDMIDGTTPQHRFFDPSTINTTTLEKMNHYVSYMLEESEKLLAPIKTLPGIIIEGNHDIRGTNAWAGFAWELSRRLSAHFGGGECIARVHSPCADKTKDSYVWMIHAQHGAGGGYMPGGKVNRFQNTASLICDADIYVRGHVHDSDCRILPRYSMTRKGEARLVERKVAYITAPAFTRNRVEGIIDYNNRMGLQPTDEGIVYLEVCNPYTSHGGNGGKILRIEANL